ncbi:hypothetical protein [Ascidiimonas aurantiaca]|uniref:hypothetical protein n=1 Tax=Ascidiimonas aurantiaca TaxID=1685432 RepID=UPI0030EBEAC2
MRLTFFGYKFIQNEERLTWNQLATATEANREANLLIKKAKTQNTVSSVLAMVGGGLIGIPIGQSIADVDPNWTLAYIGGGIAVISFPFSLSAFNNVNKGIDKYNLSLKHTSTSAFSPEFRVIANRNGIGLSMNF